MNTESVTIFLVDDDSIDVEATIRAFRKARIANPIVVADDGVDAFEHLRGTNGKEKLARPFLILLDINMPRMDGIEFLKQLRQDPELSDTVVFVLTTSKHDADILAVYEYNVAGYIVKTNVGDEFARLISMLEHYWRVVELPVAKRSYCG